MLSSSPTRTLPPASAAIARNGSCRRPIEKADQIAPDGSWSTIAVSVGMSLGAPYGMPVQSWISAGLVDQAVTDQLLDHHEMAGVEDLELGPHAERLHAARHRSSMAGVFVMT